MTTPLRNQPFSSSSFAAAAEAWPALHPLHAAMRAMGTGTGAGPAPTPEALQARRDSDLAFWRGLPGADAVRACLARRYADRIAAAERLQARAARVARIEAALDTAETALALTMDVGEPFTPRV